MLPLGIAASQTNARGQVLSGSDPEADHLLRGRPLYPPLHFERALLVWSHHGIQQPLVCSHAIQLVAEKFSSTQLGISQ